jgi:hypothetical protein
MICCIDRAGASSSSPTPACWSAAAAAQGRAPTCRTPPRSPFSPSPRRVPDPRPPLGNGETSIPTSSPRPRHHGPPRIPRAAAGSTSTQVDEERVDGARPGPPPPPAFRHLPLHAWSTSSRDNEERLDVARRGPPELLGRPTASGAKVEDDRSSWEGRRRLFLCFAGARRATSP